MKNHLLTFVAFLFFFNGSLPITADAQGTVVTYQGRVTDSGTNFSGSGQFKFALVTGTNANYTTFWSNDGTSVNGSEPAAPVRVNVSNGLFAVVLGDATQSNMTSIAASVFNQPNLRLRIWFNDGVSGSLALDPPQNLTPAPYAVFANTASNLTSGFTVLPGTNGSPNVVGGSSINFISNGVVGATISGGGSTNRFNQVLSNSVVGSFGTVGGGLGNTADVLSTVSGGQENSAIGVAATVGGGFDNIASLDYATVAGGTENSATNIYATVPGGYRNTAGGVGSFAAGLGAQALHNGSFVWSDGSSPSFASANDSQFSVQASGGVRLLDGGHGVAIGSGGQYFAMGGTEKLRIIRGVVDASGNKIHGADFTVTRTGVGAYTVNFINGAFASFPAVTVTVQSGVARIATVTKVDVVTVQVRIFDAAGAATDNQFHFIAVFVQ